MIHEAKCQTPRRFSFNLNCVTWKKFLQQTFMDEVVVFSCLCVGVGWKNRLLTEMKSVQLVLQLVNRCLLCWLVCQLQTLTPVCSMGQMFIMYLYQYAGGFILGR